MWLSLFSQQRLWSLLSYYTLCSLTNCCSVSMAASYFEWTSCLQNVGSRLSDYTELHPRNSKRTLYRLTSPCRKIAFNYAFLCLANSTGSPSLTTDHQLSRIRVTGEKTYKNSKNVHSNRSMTLRKVAVNFTMYSLQQRNNIWNPYGVRIWQFG
jgi:hypothetical protein